MQSEQEALVTAFTEGRVDGAPAPVQRIDTHLSHVFLCGALAFKLKRAIALPFVDFSTLQARHAACQEELSVNRAFADALYLDVRAIARTSDGRFSVAAQAHHESDIVDWVVVMRRFDGALQFDRMAGDGALTRAHIEEAASVVARAHANAKPQTLTGHAVDYRGIIHELRETEAHGAQKLGLSPAAPSLFERLEFELTRISSHIEHRREAGKVRRCHGDLHLRNICLFEGKALPFDALEFDAHLATIDVLYDFAFLLMDLRHVGRPDLANAAMNAYWDAASEDEAALALLPFFMSLRAAVRMAVAVEAGDLEEAQAYRALGTELLQQTSSELVAIGGLSGVGKSAIARAVAWRLPGPAGARVLRTDVLRKRSIGKPVNEAAPDDAYTPTHRAEIYNDATLRAAAAFQAGASAIFDATFQESNLRRAIVEALQGKKLHAIWLHAPLSVRLARIAGRKGDASDADAEVAAAQQEPGDQLTQPWRLINAERPIEDIAEEIAAEIKTSPRA